MRRSLVRKLGEEHPGLKRASRILKHPAFEALKGVVALKNYEELKSFMGVGAMEEQVQELINEAKEALRVTVRKY